MIVLMSGNLSATPLLPGTERESSDRSEILNSDRKLAGVGDPMRWFGQTIVMLHLEQRSPDGRS